jgi:SAM-dependent methyltransferase
MGIIIGIIAIILLGFLYMTLSVWWPMLTGGAGFTPTPYNKASLAMELAEVGPEDYVYDLGCGTGVVLEEAKRRGATVVGIEVEPVRWLTARLRVRGVKIKLGNMFKLPIDNATVVFIFQYPDVNQRLKRKFTQELRPGTRVVSYMWEIKGWKPAKVVEDVYLYIIGESDEKPW